MSKNLLSIIITVVLIAVGGLLIVSYTNGTLTGFFSSFVKPKVDLGGIILFYGDGCPHCKNVDDFLAQNKVEEKVKVTKLEVWNNRDNQKVLAQVIQKCGISTEQVGVPFLWDGKACTMGDQDIIKFFQEKIK